MLKNLITINYEVNFGPVYDDVSYDHVYIEQNISVF